MNRIEFSEDKKDWHEVDEPISDERLKGKQQVYFRYRIYYQEGIGWSLVVPPIIWYM